MKTKLLATFGSISSGTLRECDLLSAFTSELEWQIARNGEFYSQPENFAERDRLNALVGEAQDCFEEDGEAIDCAKQDIANELINERLFDALNEFAPPYAYFGAHPGDGADFGYWLSDVEEIKEQVEFSSSEAEEYPAADYRGEWLHINERGNCTLYVRGEDGQDKEIWSVC